MARLNDPIPPDWRKYVTQSPIALEVVPDQLWDTVTYTSGTSIQLNFFNATRANLSLSNMTQPGFLPNPQSFLVQAVRIYVRSRARTDDAGAAGAFASGYDDIVQLANTGRLTWTLGQKRYGPWLVWTLPAGSYAQGVMASAGAEAANLVHDYAQIGGPLYGLFPHLMISPLQNFQIDLDWPAALTLAGGDTAITVMLDGQRARAVQ